MPQATENDTTRALRPDPRTLVEVWIAMNEDASYQVGTDQEEAATRLTETQGGFQCRTCRLTVAMTPPVAVEAAVTIPDDVGHVVDINTATD